MFYIDYSNVRRKRNSFGEYKSLINLVVDLTISSPSIGGNQSDGTVVWRINCSAGLTGNVLRNTTLLTNNDSSGTMLNIIAGTEYTKGGHLALYNYSNPYETNPNPGGFALCVANGTDATVKRLIGHVNGNLEWNYTDLAVIGVVSKNITGNGPYYIKFACGLIIQWGLYSGTFDIDSDGLGYKFALPFAISFSTGFSLSLLGSSDINWKTPKQYYAASHNLSAILILTNTNVNAYWFAIGY